MEGNKITRLPTAATPAERASMRDRQRGIETGKVTELYAAPDLAKMVGIRRIIEEERTSEIAPYRFGIDKIQEARLEIESLPLPKAIEEINSATEDMVRLDPIRYSALLDSVESIIQTSQDDE